MISTSIAATLYLGSILGLVIIALLVLVKVKKALYLSYGIFCLLITLWLSLQFVAQYLLHEDALFLIRASVFISSLMSIPFFVFVEHYIHGKWHWRRIPVGLSVLGVIFASTAFSELMIQVVKASNAGISIEEAGVLYTLQTALVGAGFIYGIARLVKFSRTQKDRTHRKSTNLLVAGFSFSLVCSLLAASVFANSDTIQLIIPLSFLVMATTVYYSIVKHQLFDIKLVVARFLVYLLSISVLVSLYAFSAFSLTTSFLAGRDESHTYQNIVYTLLAVFLAFTFQPLKYFFDRASRKIFFRDAYDTQAVLDKISTVIVGNVDPHKVQKGALAALYEALRPTYAAFVFLSINGTIQKGDLIGQQWNVHDPINFHNLLRRIGKKVVIYDELEESHKQLRADLRIEDVSVVAPLITKDETVGYLLLGSKKSGNIYTLQDIGLLNIATNELAVALQNAQRFEEIQAFNITLQEKITEATRELKITNKKLIALDEAKDEFISMASHQLRTPLTSIKGYISMLLEGDLGKISKAQEKALKEAFTSAQRMVFLISDFLNVSRIKTGKFVIELKEIFMPTMIQEELTQLKEMFESKGLDYTYEPPEEFPMVKLDDNKTRQVMMNMIDNAIYYTPSGGTINIQLYSTGDEVIFKVIDTGIGVPKAEQHKLFTKFFRAANARKARPDGTGLGLYMAQKVVVEQGGAIIFESTEGKGSTFGFRFPLSKIRANS